MKPRARSSNRLSRQQLADTVPIPVKAGSGSRSLRLKRVREEPRRHLPWPVIALFIAWALPWRVLVGGLAISPYRIVLIIMILPCLGLWLSGRAGRIRVADIAVLCFCLWGALSLLVLNGGSAAIQSGGILFVETMGAYLLARCYIRNADDFRGLARLLFWIVALLLPFAIIEAISGRDVGLALFSSILPSHPVTTNIPRWGLRRVQTIFEHPILMGVCCSSILALTHLVLGEGKPLARRWTRSLIVVLTAALSLSSGPWSAIVVQSGLMGWNWSLGSIRARWKILIGLVVAMLVLIQLFAKRPLPNILFSSFAFDADSAFFRLLIWNYGTESVGNHPLFGVGLGEWDRPFWMGPSIDMFWLYNAITYGLPGGLLMLLAFLSIILPIGFRDLPDGKLYQYRAAFLIAMTSLFLVGWMVHFWNATYVLFMFLMGSGVWLLDSDASGPATLASRRMRRAPRRPSRAASPPQVQAPPPAAVDGP